MASFALFVGRGVTLHEAQVTRKDASQRPTVGRRMNGRGPLRACPRRWVYSFSSRIAYSELSLSLVMTAQATMCPALDSRDVPGWQISGASSSKVV